MNNGNFFCSPSHFISFVIHLKGFNILPVYWSLLLYDNKHKELLIEPPYTEKKMVS